MSGEVWKTVTARPGYCLEVSSAGTFRETRTIKPRNSMGYSLLPLRLGFISIGYLVAQHFIGPPPLPSSKAVHINGDRSDNRVENLLWIPNPQHVIIEFSEKWRPVKCHSAYEVSNNGRIARVLPDGSRKIRKTDKLNGTIVAKGRRISIARIVAETWISPPPRQDAVIYHINGDKTDNRVGNLIWIPQ